MPDENKATTTFKASEFKTSSQSPKRAVKHQTLIQKLSAISRQTDEVLARLEQEEEERIGSPNEDA